MNQICIAKKVSQGNVEFLDFAVGDDDQLITFASFKDASDFLKSEIGNSEEMLNYLITSVEAQKDNPRMKEVLAKSATVEPVARSTSETQSIELKPTESGEVECYFVLDCKNYFISNNDSIFDVETGKQLVPVLAFVDAANPTELVQVPRFVLKQSFIGDVAVAPVPV